MTGPTIPARASLGAGRQWRARLVQHHLPLAIGCLAALVLLTGWSPGHGGSTLVRRLGVPTGYVAPALIALTLLVGPANLLLRRRNPPNSFLRRDIGTWAAGFSAVHAVIELQSHGAGRFAFIDYFVRDGRLLTSDFGLGNWTGLAALTVVLALLTVSTNRTMQDLKAPRWKMVQRLNYLLFGLSVLHATFYGPLDRPASPFTRLLIATTVAVFVGQAAGVWMWSRRKLKSAPPMSEGIVCRSNQAPPASNRPAHRRVCGG